MFHCAQWIVQCHLKACLFLEQPGRCDKRDHLASSVSPANFDVLINSIYLTPIDLNMKNQSNTLGIQGFFALKILSEWLPSSASGLLSRAPSPTDQITEECFWQHFWKGREKEGGKSHCLCLRFPSNYSFTSWHNYLDKLTAPFPPFSLTMTKSH